MSLREPIQNTLSEIVGHLRAASSNHQPSSVYPQQYTHPSPSIHSASPALSTPSTVRPLTGLDLSEAFQLAGKKHEALFVGQWVAPFLLLGIYNKMVKQHGSDAETRG